MIMIYYTRTAEEVDKTVETVIETEREIEAEPEPEEDEIEKAKPKKIPNQFNFCERAALTYDNPMRVCTLYLLFVRNSNVDIINPVSLWKAKVLKIIRTE